MNNAERRLQEIEERLEAVEAPEPPADLLASIQEEIPEDLGGEIRGRGSADPLHHVLLQGLELAAVDGIDLGLQGSEISGGGLCIGPVDDIPHRRSLEPLEDHSVTSPDLCGAEAARDGCSEVVQESGDLELPARPLGSVGSAVELQGAVASPGEDLGLAALADLLADHDASAAVPAINPPR